jgi:hypothetical protein
MLPVMPAAITGVAGGSASQRVAQAASSRLRRSAGSSRPWSATTSGQTSARSFRNSSVCCQWLASSPWTSASSRSSGVLSVATSSRKRVSSAASRTACSWLTLPSRASTSRARSRCRRSGGSAGSSSSSASGSSSSSSSASISPTGWSRGSSSARPPACLASVSRSARQARRLGSRTSVSASSSPPCSPCRSSPAASASRNGTWAGMV